MSSSNSPCAACKFLRRKCTQECVFAPYFPPDQPTRFANVHRVFGASNVAKLLNELSASQREDAVTSLAYEADARLKDPVYGCVGLISILQHRLRQVQDEIYTAKKELYSYIGDQAMMPILGNPGYMQQQQPHPGGNPSYNMSGMLGLGGGGAGPSSGGQLVIRDSQQQQQQQILQQQQLQQHHHQMIEAQQLAAAVAAREQQELMRSYEQQQLLQQQQQQHHQQQQHDFLRFNSEFDQTEAVAGSGFNPMTPAAAAMSPSLALGGFDNPYEIQQQQQQQQQLQLQQHEHHHHHHQPHHHPQHQIQAQLLLQSQQPQQLQLQLQQQQQQQQPPSPLPLQQQQQHHQNNQHQRSGSDEGRSVGPST